MSLPKKPNILNGSTFSMKKLLCLVIILISVQGPGLSYSVDNNPYRHIQVLDRNGKYVLEWLVDWEEHRIYFNVTVATLGYVGFGLSKKGKMSGADIVIGGVTPTGEPYFTDRHAIGNQLPEIDDSQDWTLHSAWESKSHTFLSFSRQLETCDHDHDLPINEDVLAVIWAYGERDNEIEYHHQNRGKFDVYLLDPDLAPRVVREQNFKNISTPASINQLGDWKVWNIPTTQVLPPQDTAYICTFHKAPRQRSKQHIVGFRSVLNSDLEIRHIHHFLLHICYPPEGVDANEMFGRYVGRPGEECYVLTSPAYGIPTQYCREVRHEWAVGAGPIFFPEHVGVPMSESRNEYYMLQMHYDNPQSLPNIRLQFSLEIYYTEKLRKHDAGLLYVGVGTPGSPSIMIPPSSTNHVMYGHCGSQCTRKMFPENGINIFAAKLHTHLAGIGTRFLHIQDKKELPLLIDDNYNFNFQPVRVLREEQIVRPGDMLVKRCIYDTTGRNGSATVGGFSTRNEMCNGFIWYYPYLRSDIYGVCSSEIKSETYRNFLQIFNTTWSDERRENVVTSPQGNAGLTVSEVGTNRINWTIDKRTQLQTHHRFHPQISGCPSLSPNDVNTARRRPRPLALNQLNNHGYWSSSAYHGLHESDEINDLNGEIMDPTSEFVSLWPKNLTPYQRTSRCLKYKF